MSSSIRINAMFNVQRIYYSCHYVAGEVRLFSIAAGAGGFKPWYSWSTLEVQTRTSEQVCQQKLQLDVCLLQIFEYSKEHSCLVTIKNTHPKLCCLLDVFRYCWIDNLLSVIFINIWIKSFSAIWRKAATTCWASWCVLSQKILGRVSPMRALWPLNNELQRAPVTKYEVLFTDRRPLFQKFSI